MGEKKIKLIGFTIVELIVVISVIGILASITIVGYGAWQKRTYENVVKSDLINAGSAMESARNFGTGYPSTVPPSFKASENVFISGGSVDASTYCLQAVSTKDTTVSMYITNASTTPASGNCSSSTGLIAWWPMNGNANDASGNGRNGTVIGGATLTTNKNGESNSAYGFNGSTSYIETPSINISNAITTSAWVYSSNFNQTGFIIGKNPVNDQWEIFFESSVLRWRGGGPSVQNATYCSIPTNNVWHHVVGSQTGTTAALYIDGVQCGGDATYNPIGNGSGTIDIGRFNGGYYYNGSIDDVRIYNRALSLAEVQALYSAGAQ